MKTLKIILLLCFLYHSIKAQIVYEHTYSSYNALTLVNLETTGFKYVTYSPFSNLINLYNLNHSLYKTINIPVQNNSIYYVGYLRERLFDLDTADLEYALEGHDTLLQLSYIRVYDEFGSILFSRDTVEFYDFGEIIDPAGNLLNIVNKDTGSVLILQKSDSAPWGAVHDWEVYSLPGKLENCCCDNFTTNIINQNSPHRINFSAFPNPSKEKIILEYELPNAITKAELIIFSSVSKELKRFKITNAFKRLELDNSDLSSGTYFYQLLLPNGEFGTKKIIIVK